MTLSVMLGADILDEASEYATEGTVAHSICGCKV